ncbi:nuclear transport factor 2 family protein [Actinoplanes sp. NPDC051851]|uniref:nuclear transport factor 2 family protein n=1 Tax=Actinoplanes sp. NPDC051851 TaxID=3154753 RepID=UPI003447F944
MDQRELSDRSDIQALLFRYARAVDCKDWALWRTVFTEDAHLDYSSGRGPAGDRETIAAWLEQSFTHVDGAHHHITNIEIEFEPGGDEARVVALFYNPFRASWSATWSAAGGYYRHTVVRTPRGWRSRELIEDNRWVQNPPDHPAARPQ